MRKVKSFEALSLILRMLTPCIFTKLNNKLSELSSLLRSERLQPHLPIQLLRSYIRNSSSDIDVMTRRLVSIESNVRQGARAGYLSKIPLSCFSAPM